MKSSETRGEMQSTSAPKAALVFGFFFFFSLLLGPSSTTADRIRQIPFCFLFSSPDRRLGLIETRKKTLITLIKSGKSLKNAVLLATRSRRNKRTPLDEKKRIDPTEIAF